MTESKSIFASKSVWGAVVAILASLLGLAGISLVESDQASLVELLAQAATLVGAGVALYGRISATQKLRG